jgi:hypothetical protein
MKMSAQIEFMAHGSCDWVLYFSKMHAHPSVIYDMLSIHYVYRKSVENFIFRIWILWKVCKVRLSDGKWSEGTAI